MKTLASIAEELQGYDPQALKASDVNEFLSRLVEPISESEDVDLFSALGRVLARSVVSPISVPPHDNSAMDGYAFDGGQLRAGLALTLTVVGTALAGEAPSDTLAPGQCLRIMTGALMPAGLDTVAPQELASVAGDQVTLAPDTLRAGDNRRFAGEDLLQGSVALAQGERLGPAALGLLASLGLPRLRVLRRPRVAYFSTGNEILSLGDEARVGAVYDSNRYTVFGLLTRLGCEVIDMGVVRDEPAALETAFRSAALDCDAIITSGGVSVGEADYTKLMMRQLGDVAFWKIAMRPGRPMAVGRIGRALLFGLPGNPVAVMVTFLAFVRPALLQMMGCSASAPPLLRARSAQTLRKKPGRTEYQRGVVSTAPDGSLSVCTTGNQGSGVLSSMVQSNGLIVLRHEQGDVAVGDEVDVMMFEGAI